jgi:hypothetical protein
LWWQMGAPEEAMPAEENEENSVAIAFPSSSTLQSHPEHDQGRTVSNPLLSCLGM